MSDKNRLLDSWRTNQLTQLLFEHMRRYGYQAVDLPIIQAADLFLVKAGDQVVNRLFTFERDGQQLALRPEFTAAAAYQYVMDNDRQQPVIRWQFSGYVFEDDPHNFQSNHQRFSIGAELIGIAAIAADAEIIGMAVQGLTRQGLGDYQLTLGHIGLLRQMLSRFQLDSRIEHFLLNHLYALNSPDLGKPFVLGQLQKLVSGNYTASQEQLLPDVTSTLPEADTHHMLNVVLDATYPGNTLGGRTKSDIARRLSQKRNRYLAQDQLIAALDFLETLTHISTSPGKAFTEIGKLISPDDADSQSLLAGWKNLVDLLKLYDIPENRLRLQPVLARSWDYYSGVVFELSNSDGVHLGGGGRYDGLTRLVGGQQTVPAVGFAYYADEIIRVLPEVGAQDQRLLTIAYDSDAAAVATSWAEALRSAGSLVQILPSKAVESSLQPVLCAQTNQSIQLKDQFYTLDQLDTLLMELKRDS